MSTDKLRSLIAIAFEATCEAEQIQVASGEKDVVYWSLIRAHSELLRARNYHAAKRAA